MKTIDEVLKNKEGGLVYGNRVIIPVVVDLLKVQIEDHLITDFSTSASGAEYYKDEYFTEIYFHDFKDLSDNISEYESIKMFVVEEGKDIFDFKNHRCLVLHLKGKHKVEIEELSNDMLFIE
ncbi:MAG: hypothetical protein PVH88_23155 [Ignavibacteria bacterium]|jgi:hypothetical protein